MLCQPKATPGFALVLKIDVSQFLPYVQGTESKEQELQKEILYWILLWAFIIHSAMGKPLFLLRLL